MMKWQPSYAIGIDSIDAQHKRLFEIAEEAEELLLLPNYVDKFDEILHIVEELKDYVCFHFTEEEKILREIKYKKYFGHCVYHQDFIAEMEKIDLTEIDRNQTKELYKLVSLVTDWLVEHVLEEDKAWAEVYKER